MSPTGNELGPSAPRYSQPHQHYCYNSLTPTMYNTQFPPLHPQQACPLSPQSSHYYSQDPPLGPIRTTPPTHTLLSPKNTTEATSDIEVSNDPNTLTPPHDWQSVNRTKRRSRELSHPNEDAAQASSMPLSKICTFSTNNLTLTPANWPRHQLLQHQNPLPPIFIYGVLDYQKMIDNVSKATEEETYQCKILQNNIVKKNNPNPTDLLQTHSALKQRKDYTPHLSNETGKGL